MNSSTWTGGRFGCLLTLGAAALLATPSPRAATFRAAPDQINLRIPPAKTGGSPEGSENTTISTIHVNGFGSGRTNIYLKVNLSLRHTYDRDLVITLVGPDGSNAVLAYRQGGSGHDYLDTIFDDLVRRAIFSSSPPFTGTFYPDDPFDLFMTTTNLNGPWQLQITDLQSGDTGTLSDWSITLEADAVACPPAPTWSVLVPVGPMAALATDGLLNGGASSSFSVAAGTLSRLRNSDGQVLWSRSYSGANLNRPLAVLDRYDAERIFVTDRAGYLRSVDPASGIEVGAINTRRPYCASDSIWAAAAAQLWNRSSAAFKTQFSNDLIFVVTAPGCADSTLGSVKAFFAQTLDPLWTFNGLGTEAMDAGTFVLLDEAANVLYCCSDLQSGQDQNTIWAINTLDGTLNWALNAGAIRVPPVLANGWLYVLNANGDLRKFDAATGTEHWLFPDSLNGLTEFSFDSLRNKLLALDTFGRLRAITDLGDAPEWTWTRLPPAGVAFSTGPIVIPGFGKIYLGGDDGRLYQVDIVSADTEASADVSVWGGAVNGIFPDSTCGGAFVDRLLASAGSTLRRFCIPWAPGVTGESNGPALPSTDLRITVRGPTPAFWINQPASWTLAITNAGPGHATNVALVWKLPTELTCFSVSASQGSCARVDNLVRAELGTVLNRGSATVLVSLLATNVNRNEARAYVSGACGDTDPVSDSVLVDLTAASVPKLSIEPMGPRVRLSWPASSAQFTLESAPNLFGSNWSSVTSTAVVSGGLNLVTNNAADASRFYRLRLRP